MPVCLQTALFCASVSQIHLCILRYGSRKAQFSSKHSSNAIRPHYRVSNSGKKMTKITTIFLLVFLSFASFSVMAENAGDNDTAERLRLAKDLHDVRQIRESINATIKAAADTIPPADREDFMRYVELKVDYDALENKSIQYAAETYTVPELQAMIAYFGSAAGKSAEQKGEEYSSKIGKDITAQIDAAILAAKYDGVPETSLPKINQAK